MAEKTPAGQTDQLSPLELYFEHFQEVIGLYCSKAIELLPEKESEPLIRGLEDTAKTQVRELAGDVLPAYRSAPAAQKERLDRQFANLGGTALMETARHAIAAVSSPAGLTNFAGIFTLIKKLIKILFPRGLGGLIDRLLEFFDEIEREILGTVSRTGAQHRFEEERRYLELQYHLARLERAQAERDAVVGGNEE